eukprot:CAMPEP_0181188810 /NCGR_PEP_ID=MMETSP1096-20121128/11325_1 /TAXON_ID=156174 ORGANISM="Chrysochromulina ericina, Strain CCMP281" /NCGR_SAMPLE_ID=MMETSP1096 /ASSEMBLY_ACC=CAM_ASM_000453 /LENGTH=61 /DNA_ID=CAMNT_0023277917 /DNA_START=305 /DNA_END=491 /DNA_ORIENTATION=+
MEDDLQIVGAQLIDTWSVAQDAEPDGVPVQTLLGVQVVLRLLSASSSGSACSSSSSLLVGG